MSPPTSSGAAVRVLVKVATSVPSSLTCRVGWRFQTLLRYSSTSGWWKVTAEPTRTGLLAESHGSGTDLLAVLLKLVLAPSSRVIDLAALAAWIAAIAAVS